LWPRAALVPDCCRARAHAARRVRRRAADDRRARRDRRRTGCGDRRAARYAGLYPPRMGRHMARLRRRRRDVRGAAARHRGAGRADRAATGGAACVRGRCAWHVGRMLGRMLHRCDMLHVKCHSARGGAARHAVRSVARCGMLQQYHLAWCVWMLHVAWQDASCCTRHARMRRRMPVAAAHGSGRSAHSPAQADGWRRCCAETALGPHRRCRPRALLRRRAGGCAPPLGAPAHAHAAVCSAEVAAASAAGRIRCA
jgi:hypothetical protein